MIYRLNTEYAFNEVIIYKKKLETKRGYFLLKIDIEYKTKVKYHLIMFQISKIYNVQKL